MYNVRSHLCYVLRMLVDSEAIDGRVGGSEQGVECYQIPADTLLQCVLYSKPLEIALTGASHLG